MHIRECERCKERIKVDPRIGQAQRVCAKSACLQWRAAQSKRQWRADNGDYYQGSADRHRAGYWTAYRSAHPDKAKQQRAQNRERMLQRRILCATQDAIRRNPVGYLQGLREGVVCATQDTIVRRVDGILTYLDVCATQDSMDERLAPAG